MHGTDEANAETGGPDTGLQKPRWIRGKREKARCRTALKVAVGTARERHHAAVLADKSHRFVA